MELVSERSAARRPMSVPIVYSSFVYPCFSSPLAGFVEKKTLTVQNDVVVVFFFIGITTT
jgi:hypothetical protein